MLTWIILAAAGILAALFCFTNIQRRQNMTQLDLQCIVKLAAKK